MSKIRSSQWLKYFVTMLVGIFIFISVIPSCTSNISETKPLEEIIADLPTAEAIQLMSAAPHPRLLATADRFAEIKKQIETDKTMKKWYEKIHRHAKAILKDELSVYELENGKRLISKIHGQIPTLAFVYRMEKDQLYLDKAWQILNTASQFQDWNPSHFLNTAMITYGFAIGYDWLYEDWNQNQRNIIISAILEKGLKPAINAHKLGTMWVKAEHNWNQVCNGGISIGALAVIEKYPEIASIVLEQSLQGLPHAMSTYSPDGGWNEGLKYWNYGTFYNTSAIAALKTSFNDDFGLSKVLGFQETGLFPIYMNGPTNIPFNFSDANDESISSPVLFWMSERYKRPVYSYYQKKSSVHGVMDLVWYKPKNKQETLQKLPLDNYFEGAEVTSLRSEWENPNGIFVGFKAGDNEATHSNLDLGTFVLDALGVRWAIELGRDDYNLPGYFDQEDQRWTYYKTRAEGQNTLVVNPTEGPDQNPGAKSKIIRFVSQAEKGYAIADLTQAYSPKITKIHRGISLQNQRQQVLVQDEIRTDTPIDLFWFMHTKADIKISQDGKTALLYQDGQRLWAKLLNPEPDYKFTVMDAKPLTTSPNPQGQAKNLNLKKLTIKLKGIKNKDLAVLFVPLNKRQNPPKKNQNIKELSQW